MKFSEEHIVSLIIAYQERGISDEEINELSEWLDADPDHANKFAKYLALLKEGKAVSQFDQIKSDEAWTKISKSLTMPKKETKVRKLKSWLPHVAAVVVVSLVSYFVLHQVSSDFDSNKTYNFAEVSTIGSKKAILTLEGGQKLKLEKNLTKVISEIDGTRINKDSTNSLTYNNSQSHKTKLIYNRIDVPRGGEYNLILADGTRVWLNSQSSLRYPVQFMGKTRQVELTGEGYFEVAHNPKQAFIIKARDTEVKVLGTKFNVSTYDDEEFIATTLVEGSVELSSLGEKIRLKPGFQAVIKRGDDEFQIQAVNTDLYTSWMKGVFEFRNHSLEDICHQLSRWYSVEFFFVENQYRQLRFTGAVKREKSIDFALEMIEKMANVKFAIKDDKIIVGRPTD